ncbi:MAG: hypothetical protein A2087_06610 [Spirochaetes bacterium GWD1_61_31]|nr:MAG: hypothetical protein A2Y37_08860 [Spirochaetes bacterium GWB1_60_80]OHD31882.1 MAG: hypothetical protein A2004_10245 [Spirochaetes bacterium GWC1_61_12]OHD40021.1 MAG: hypothetical protein A2087_06610 [Spirochaetes bacterium GWD1_61_31]OHD42325.1 MAG: hypothetical protein A2Y35_11390 [Spirochaetes bacterium GWE1_60_18]OHD58475.1 MAG: hypothetical protein A2Y32_06895 [Spirochaetes bacterium GWF1_60_12]HAW85466.1 hypothetical protein [Spirochaetaceae bacterium]
MKIVGRGLVGALLMMVASLPLVTAQAEPPLAADQGGAADTVVYGAEFNFAAAWLPNGLPATLGALDQLAWALPMLQARFGLAAGNGWSAYATVDLIKEHHLDSIFNIAIGPTGNPFPIENNFASEGVLRYDNPQLSIILGRQAASQGPSTLSNLQVTRHLPYLDALRVEVRLGPDWSFSQIVASLENRAVLGDVTLPVIDGQPIDGYDFETTNIWLSSRRFALRGDWFEFGIGALSLVSRPYNAFHIGDILPVFSMHNGNPGWHNLSLHADFSVDLWPGQRQYLIAGLDDFNANLVGIGDGGVPTIWAVILGGDGTVEFGGLNLKYGLEMAATHYLWGNFHAHHILSRALYRYAIDWPLLLPLTSPYGPGRLSFAGEASLALPWQLALQLSGLLLFGDPDINLVTTSYEVQVTETEFLLGRMDLRVSRTLFDGLTAYLSGGLDFLPGGLEWRIQAGAAWKISVGSVFKAENR